MNGQYTVAAPPPSQLPRQRFSMWEELFDECRDHKGEWRRTMNAMKKTTATQLASDVRNAYKRNFTKSRLKGLSPDEIWDAAWGELDGKFYLWIKFDGLRSENPDRAEFDFDDLLDDDFFDDDEEPAPAPEPSRQVRSSSAPDRTPLPRARRSS